jgi:hypothetical protein
MSRIKKLRGEGATPNTTETPPAPVDLLDILAAQNNKIDNAKYRASCMERMELPPQTTNHTKIVATILSLQKEVVSL